MNKLCNFCGLPTENFFPYRLGAKDMPANMITLKVIGSDVENYGCPHCKSTDRERHLKLYCEKYLSFKSGMDILHFAPEPQFLSWLAVHSPRVHILADFNPTNPSYEKINIQEIPYSANSFDLVIANHVLEHVDDYKAALQEINRVLKPNGKAILQTPFSPVIYENFEDLGIDSDELRLAFYGQEDHQRLFGKEIFGEFSQHLNPLIKTHAESFPSDVSYRFGVNKDEPFFLFSKQSANEDFETKKNSRAPRKHKCLESTNPRLSIVCITYNHESFLSEALESFASQKGDFSVEIIIADDASTDDTASIAEDFIRHSNLPVKLFSQEKNVGPYKNFSTALKMASGKYIALCEGDDFWTDNRKAEKQVLKLESESNIALAYSGVNSWVHGRVPRTDFAYVGGARRNLSPLELQMAYPINTLTACFRNILGDLPPEFFTCGPGDLFLWSLLGKYGSGAYCREVLPSIYRQHDGGMHSSLTTANKMASEIKTYASLLCYHSRNSSGDLADYFAERVVARVRQIRKLNEPWLVGKLDSLPAEMAMAAEGLYDFPEHICKTLIDIGLDSSRDGYKISIRKG